MLSRSNIGVKSVSHFLLFVSLLTFCYSSASESNKREYKGHLSIKLFLHDQTMYSHGLSFKTSTRQFRSAIIASSASGKVSDRFHFELDILSEKNDLFNAKIAVYENITNQKTDLAQQQEVLSYLFSGKLYQQQKLEFTSANKPTLKISLFVDKIFSLEEIKKRFNQSNQ